MDMGNGVCEIDRAAYLALNTIFGYHPIDGRGLIEILGKASDAFLYEKRGIVEEAFRSNPKTLSKLTTATLDKGLKELREIGKEGYRFLTIEDEEYPSLLKECPDAPLGLYIRGKDPPDKIFAEKRPRVSIVGTRDVSRYGIEWCEKIVDALSACSERPMIVSGLAIGVDVIAHRAALESGLPTIGVMATGIDSVYPFRHGFIADRIAKSDSSALVTDYPRGTSPIAVNFLRRNRIIAGLSEATILVESKVKGGGMITARLASSYDRSVFALPGRADDERSGGCNLLIRENTAELITDTDTLVKSLGFKGVTAEKTDIIAEAEERYKGVDEEGLLLSVLKEIKTEGGLTTEELSVRTGLPFQKVSSAVGILESDSLLSSDILGRCFINGGRRPGTKKQ